MRYQVNIPANLIPATAGSQIHVFHAGTSTYVGATLYADPVTNTPLANPYSHPGGKVNFYVSQALKVSVGVQPSGAAAPVVAPAVDAKTSTPSYATLKSPGAPPMWVLT